MLYRIIQEMVNNTLKHAQAKYISLKINRSANDLELIYSDDGIGFDPENIPGTTTSSLGLKGIQSRSGFLGGEVKIDSSPGKGVKFTIRVPIK
jgi:signal transduction histidine kinase